MKKKLLLFLSFLLMAVPIWAMMEEDASLGSDGDVLNRSLVALDASLQADLAPAMSQASQDIPSGKMRIFNTLNEQIYVRWYVYKQNTGARQSGHVVAIDPRAFADIEDQRVSRTGQAWKATKSALESFLSQVKLAPQGPGMVGRAGPQLFVTTNKELLQDVFAFDEVKNILLQEEWKGGAILDAPDIPPNLGLDITRKNFLWSTANRYMFAVSVNEHAVLRVRSSGGDRIAFRNSTQHQVTAIPPNHIIAPYDLDSILGDIAHIGHPVGPITSITIRWNGQQHETSAFGAGRYTISSLPGGNLGIRKTGDSELRELSIHKDQVDKFKANKPDGRMDGIVYQNNYEIQQLEAREFFIERDKIIKDAIVKLFPELQLQTLDGDFIVPRVAFTSTGGGHRANLFTLGALRQAERQGLYSAFSYMTGLSGSTWAIFPLVASGQTPTEYIEELKKGQRIQDVWNPDQPWRGLMYMRSSLQNEGGDERFSFLRAQKYFFDQHSGLVGKYGALISDGLLSFLGDRRLIFPMSGLKDRFNYPLPIGVAADTARGAKRERWYEVSPYCFGSPENQQWIPAEYTGSVFRGDEVFDEKPEQPLSYWIGVFGSAFAADDASLEVKLPKVPGLYFATSFFMSAFLGKSQNLAGKLPNFAYHDGSQDETEYIHLIDGGHRIKKHAGMPYRHNFASTPVLWRPVDIVIMLDCNEGNESKHLVASALQAQEYADNEIGRPLFDSDIKIQELKARGDQGSFAVFNELFNLNNGVEGPVVVYVNAKDPEGKSIKKTSLAGAAKTMKFDHTADQMEKLSAFAGAAFASAEDAVKDVLLVALIDKNLENQQFFDLLRSLGVFSNYMQGNLKFFDRNVSIPQRIQIAIGRRIAVRAQAEVDIAEQEGQRKQKLYNRAARLMRPRAMREPQGLVAVSEQPAVVPPDQQGPELQGVAVPGQPAVDLPVQQEPGLLVWLYQNLVEPVVETLYAIARGLRGMLPI